MDLDPSPSEILDQIWLRVSLFDCLSINLGAVCFLPITHRNTYFTFYDSVSQLLNLGIAKTVTARDFNISAIDTEAQKQTTICCDTSMQFCVLWV